MTPSISRLSLKQAAALILAVMMLVQSGPMMMSVGHHLSEHGGSHHEAQHADPTCNIICTASHFIQSESPVLDPNIGLLLATVVILFSIIIPRFTFFPYSRPPPV